MLRNLNEWLGRAVVAGDGPIGTIEDALFDDLNWVLRYLVVDQDGRQALLIPAALSPPAGDGPLHTTLGREQIAGSPALPGETITRAYETALHAYYGWELPELELETDIDDEEEPEADEHLRAYNAIRGYPLRTPEGRAGSLDDFVVNDENWALFFMVVGAGGLFEADKQVLLPPTWVAAIDGGEIVVALNKETIQKSREYDPEHLND